MRGSSELLPCLFLCLAVAHAAASGNALARSDDSLTDCNDLPLSGALTLANAAGRFERCNPQLEQARAAVEAARGDLLSADHRPNPVLGLSTSNINPQVGTGGGGLKQRTVDSAIRLDQLIERGGKQRARADAAQSLMRAAQAQLEDGTQRGLEALMEAYANAVAADAAVALLRDSAASSRDSLAAMKRRLAVGDVAAVEVRRTELDTARAEADADAARIDQLRARGDLAAALGTGRLPENLELMPLEILTAAIGSAEPSPAASDDALATRPDLRAALARVEAGEGQLRVAQAARSRDIDVTVGFDHWPISAQNTQGTGNSYTLGFSVPLPLFDSARGGVVRAASDLRSAQTDLTARRQGASLELQRLQTQQQQAEELARRYTRELLPSANSILAAEEAAYRRGGVSLLDLLDARRSARQVAIAAINARRDAVLYRVRLRVALGISPLEATPNLSPDSIGRAP